MLSFTISYHLFWCVFLQPVQIFFVIKIKIRKSTDTPKWAKNHRNIYFWIKSLHKTEIIFVHRWLELAVSSCIRSIDYVCLQGQKGGGLSVLLGTAFSAACHGLQQPSVPMPLSEKALPPLSSSTLQKYVYPFSCLYHKWEPESNIFF